MLEKDESCQPEPPTPLFRQKRPYDLHLRHDHGIKDSLKQMCDKCGKTSSYATIKKHRETCDGIDRTPEGIVFDFTPHPEDPTKCPEPDCDFTNGVLYKVRFHYGKRHVKRNCKHCQKPINIFFYDEHLLKVHSIATTRNSKIQCTECEERFTYKSDLQHHVDMVHVREPKYICDICGHRCIAKKLLVSHRYETHVRTQRKNPCTVCGVVFRSVKPLKQHMLDNHGIKVK